MSENKNLELTVAHLAVACAAIEQKYPQIGVRTDSALAAIVDSGGNTGIIINQYGRQFIVLSVRPDESFEDRLAEMLASDRDIHQQLAHEQQHVLDTLTDEERAYLYERLTDAARLSQSDDQRPQ